MAENDDGNIAKQVRKKKVREKKKEQYISPDGFSREPATERRLNQAFAVVFNNQAGEVVLSYLKSISANRVIGPGAPDSIYTYQAGVCWLMGVIDTRKLHGEEKKP